MNQSSRSGPGNGPQGPARFPLGEGGLRRWLYLYHLAGIEEPRGHHLRLLSCVSTIYACMSIIFFPTLPESAGTLCLRSVLFLFLLPFLHLYLLLLLRLRFGLTLPPVLHPWSDWMN